MRRHAGRSRCLLALVGALLAAGAGCRSSSSETGNLTGTVRDAVTRDPVDGAEVTVGAALAYSDQQGRFTMEDLDVGERAATVTAPGYRTLERKVTIEGGDNTVVFELQRPGAVDGGQQDGPPSDGPQQDAGQHDGGTCNGSACSSGYSYGGCCAEAPYCAGPSSLYCRATCGTLNERCANGTDCCNGNCVSGYCAQTTCAASYCTYGYAYGQCCAEAQYCIGNACRATCGSVGERCGYHSDCCNNNCVSGYCAQPSCAGNGCSYGYYYGGCCAEAQYCVNYYGYSGFVCRATCGSTNERCAYASDCCSGLTCTNNSCVASCVAAGQSCTAGYANGGCCASAPYCIHYWSQPTICQATCGSASQHCQATSDCCSGLTCVYNASAGWNICTQP